MKFANQRTITAIEDCVKQLALNSDEEMILRTTFDLVHSDGRISGIRSCIDAVIAMSDEPPLIEALQDRYLRGDDAAT